MKLSFIVPGDKIRLTEDVTFEGIDYNKWGPFEGWTNLSKDTVLEVSQVYIRKNGWFQASITFKIVGGSDFERAQLAQLERERKYQLITIKSCEDILADFDAHDADFYVEKFIRYTGTNFPDKKRFYFKGDLEDCMARRKEYDITSSHRHYTEQSLLIAKQRLSEINEKINNKYKLPRVQNVIRIPLKDIETWEVELFTRTSK